MSVGLGMRAAVAACGVAVVTGAVAAPAHARDELGLSWDGRAWSGQLTGTLFGPAVRWVPGDRRTSVFHVRNQAGSGADLAIAVDSPDRDRLLARDDISVAARVGGAAWTDLDRLGDTFELNASTIGAGQSERVQVRAAFDPASTNQSQTRSLRLDFRVILSDAASQGDAPDGADAGDGAPGANGVLPDTGAPAGWPLVAAAAMIGTGAALVRRSREEAADV